MKRARRRPYVSLIPRKPGSNYLLWNLGQALASSPSTVEIQVGYFDPQNAHQFTLLKTIGPPQVAGGTFVHFDADLEDRHLVAMIVQKSMLPASPHCVAPGDIYAISRTIDPVRTHPLSKPPKFVAVTYQYPKPLKVTNIPPEMYEDVFSNRLSAEMLARLRGITVNSSFHRR